ncbi:hypothetical protein CBS9595_000024 [Malassezia furfur]|nr:hypothetical protein CBS9595_000024 [Malassezia furfur]
MRAGFDRRNLPLVRRFNNHASSLLRSSLGELSEQDARRVRRKTGGVDEEYPTDHAGVPYYDRIVVDDLNEHRTHSGRRLEIHNQRAYFDAGQDAERSQDTQQPDVHAAMAHFHSELGQWTLDLRHFEPTGPTMRTALDAMLDNMEQQKELHPGNAIQELPPDIAKQLLACHAATNEFLQQFWQAMSPSGDVASAPQTLAQRAAKARQMLDVLDRAPVRMQRIAEDAEAAQPGVGQACVEAAFSATRQAVQRALRYRQA